MFNFEKKLNKIPSIYKSTRNSQVNHTWLGFKSYKPSALQPYQPTSEQSKMATLILRPQQVLALALAPFFHDTPFGRFERSWGDVWYEDWLAQEASMTEAQKAARAAAEEAQRAKRELEAEASRMASYAQDCKYRNTVRQGRQYTLKKVQLPCKNLFYDEKAPKSQWAKDESGKLRAPLRTALTGSQCWAWEYNDPTTGKLVVKHTCSHLHPGEEDWLAEWNHNRSYRLTAADTGLAAWGAQRGAGAPMPMAAPKPKAAAKPYVDRSAW